MVCACDRYLGVLSSRDVSVESRCAGLRRSIETFSLQLLIFIVKYLLVRLVMGYGPS